MIWKCINTGNNTGLFNMEYDLNLVKDASSETTTLRLYRWTPYCISLGANQNYSEINIERAKSDNIDIVKRPTGGRAILHSEELTYSVVMILTSDSSPRKIYQEINLALIKGLKLYDSQLSSLELEGLQVDLSSFYKQSLSAACFGVPAKSEIKFAGKKLVGSAQRKIGNTLLQHGSIMCGSFHLNLAKYLNLSKEQISVIRTNLKNKTTQLETLLNNKTDYERLAESIFKGFEDYYKVEMLKDELTIK
jgi:lipoyl(octanoyl) transferase